MTYEIGILLVLSVWGEPHGRRGRRRGGFSRWRKRKVRGRTLTESPGALERLVLCRADLNPLPAWTGWRVRQTANCKQPRRPSPWRRTRHSRRSHLCKSRQRSDRAGSVFYWRPSGSRGRLDSLCVEPGGMESETLESVCNHEALVQGPWWGR